MKKIYRQISYSFNYKKLLNFNKIGIKLILILVSQFLLVLFYLTLVFDKAILTQFSKIESDTSLKGAKKTHEVIQNQIEQLHKVNSNWTIWDEVYDYSQNPDNSKYIITNFNNDTIFDLEINYASVWNKKGKRIFERKIDYHTKVISLPVEDDASSLFEKIYKNKLTQSVETLSGFALDNNKAYIFSITSIKKSSRESSYAGEQLFIREINNNYLKKLSELTNEILTLSFEQIKDFQSIYLSNSNDMIQTKLSFKTITDNDSINFSYQQNRQILSAGKAAYTKLILSFSVGFFIVLLITFMFVNVIIVNRIALIVSNLTEKNTHALSNKFITKGNDEISILASSIQKYVVDFDELQKKVNHQATLSTIGEMSASIAHELNNPLSIISSKSQILLKNSKENAFDQKLFEENLARIIQTSERMTKIIKALRSIVRENSNEQNENIDLKNCLLEVETLCHNDLVKNGIKFSIEFDSLIIQGKPVQLMQVFLNLIQNSIHAIKDEQNKWIIIYGYEDENYKQLRFTDSGTGIPEAIQDKVMNSFFTTKKAGEGTGLGLSICRRIIEEQHNGQFILDNSNSNTSFIIRFNK